MTAGFSYRADRALNLKKVFTMMNQHLKNRTRQTLIWSSLALLLLTWQHFRLSFDWLGIVTLTTVLTAAVHGLSLAWFRKRASQMDARIGLVGTLLARLYGHDDKE